MDLVGAPGDLGVSDFLFRHRLVDSLGNRRIANGGGDNRWGSFGDRSGDWFLRNDGNGLLGHKSPSLILTTDLELRLKMANWLRAIDDGFGLTDQKFKSKVESLNIL